MKPSLLPACMEILALAIVGVAWAAEPTPAISSAAIREALLTKARPAVTKLLAETERRLGQPVVFRALPDNSPVAAASIFDTGRGEPLVELRKDWEDVDVAHELMHLRMDLTEGFSVLAWRRKVERTAAVEAAFGRVQTYINDEVVHRHLADLGFKVEGEVIRPPLFDSVYTDAARYLEEGRDRANDGLAHLDAQGYGPLCRAAFLVQAELLFQNYRSRLSPARLAQTQRFIAAFRQHRPEESARADRVLELFRRHDVQTPAGQRAILVAWATQEGLEKYVGPTRYVRDGQGQWILPFPE